MKVTRKIDSFALLRLPRRAVHFLLGGEVLAFGACTAVGLLSATGDSTDPAVWTRLGLLVLLSLSWAQAGERLQRTWFSLQSERGAWASQGSVLLSTGVLVLPTWAALIQCTVVNIEMGLRQRRERADSTYKWFWSTSTVLLGTVVASTTYHGLSGNLSNTGLVEVLLIVLTMALYSLVNLGALITGMYLAVAPPTFRQLIPDAGQIGYETASLLLGVIGAVMVIHAPLLTPTVLLLAAILHRSSLVGPLRREAETDAKTGLLNYKTWLEHATARLARCDVDLTPAVAMLVDLDHFKQVNDRHGHQTGDAVLAVVGEIIRHELRDADPVGRFGGEEFVAFLGEVDEAAGREIAERIRRRVEAEPFKEGLTVTASVGLAEHSPGDRAVDLMLADADAAMYQAKRDGRNRVRSASDIVETIDGSALEIADGIPKPGTLSRFSLPRRKSTTKVRNT